MITYEVNASGFPTGAILDGNGKRYLSTDWANYFRLVNIMQAQKDAESTNNAALQDYHTKFANAQNEINAGISLNVVIPAKPLMVVVDDDGNTKKVPFTPPLPDVVPLVVSPINPTGIVSTTNIPTDRTDVLGQKIDVLINLVNMLLQRGK